MPLWRFQVTIHALERWRERCTKYGDGTVKDVFAALRESDEIMDVATLPFKVVSEGAIYLYYKPKDAYFLIRKTINGNMKVVTVMVAKAKPTPKPPKEYPPPPPIPPSTLTPEQLAENVRRTNEKNQIAKAAREAKKQKKAESAGPTQADIDAALAGLRAGRPEAFDTPAAHYGWLSEQYRMYSGEIVGETAPARRKAMKIHLAALAKEIPSAKSAYLVAKRTAEVSDGFYFPDGRVDCPAAILNLLARVESQAAEIEDLKRRVASVEPPKECV